ncbi:MAG TPA: hypothetical protein VEU96_24710 [Bryobacteraceae bacterium]|nr:hypothetical protein [Bryobacteraceae bacterium]
MDAELKQALAGMEARLNRHVDERLETTDTKLESLRRYVDERLENMETKLLTGFHNWAQTYEVRARGTSAAVREFEERLGFVEERLNKLERTRNGHDNPGEPRN